ncbi:Inorganic H+ pyrophosphatase [Gracilaria domingensis]|nr:Inorganic H+ pyrophosphatase [Gracilaria domingensis]
MNGLLGSGILAVCCAAICFGLFGPSSSFYSQRGFGSKRKLQRMELDGSQNACLTRSLNVRSLDSPLPIPSGGRMIADNYRPVAASGRSLGSVSSTSWKLFLCCLIGLFLAIVLSGFCGLFFVSDSFKPSAAVQKAALSGTWALVVQSLTNGVLCSVGGGTLVVAAILASFALYDAFGVGVMTIAYMSMGGVFCTALSLGAVGHCAQGVSCVTSEDRPGENDGVIEGVDMETTATGASFLQGASVLTGFILVLATLQQAGLQLSPRDLVGGPEQPPRKLISSSGIVVFDVLVICGFVVGSVLPLVVAGTLGAVARKRSILKLGEAEKDSIRRIGFISLRESMLPFYIALLSPFVVGFGLGSRALVSMAVSSVFASFVVGSLSRTLGASIQKGYATLGTKPIRSARRARSFALTCEMVEPAMRSVSKMLSALSLVIVSLMRPDSRYGWIGGILLGILILVVLAYIMWWRWARKGHGSQSRIPLHEPRPVSPYYVESPKFDPFKVAPGSQMSDALHAFGQPKLPVSPHVLPGLSRRTQAEFTTTALEPLSSPRVGNPAVISTTVLRDDTGRTPRAI